MTRVTVKRWLTTSDESPEPGGSPSASGTSDRRAAILRRESSIHAGLRSGHGFFLFASQEGDPFRPVPVVGCVTRLRHLENSRPDLPALPHACVVDVESFGGKVLTKFAKLERTTELLFPPPKVLYCVGVDCFVSASVHAAIRLVVSIEIYASDCHTAFDRRLPDRALCGPTEVFEFPHTANVDRENSAVGAHTIGQTAMVPPPVTTMTTHIVNHIKSYSQPPLAAQYGLFHLMMW